MLINVSLEKYVFLKLSDDGAIINYFCDSKISYTIFIFKILLDSKFSCYKKFIYIYYIANSLSPVSNF